MLGPIYKHCPYVRHGTLHLFVRGAERVYTNFTPAPSPHYGLVLFVLVDEVVANAGFEVTHWNNGLILGMKSLP